LSCHPSSNKRFSCRGDADFANKLLWGIQITAAETVGVEQRGKFHENTGALRDMVPNHVFQLFQLLAMTTMEPPISFDADAVWYKKAEVIGFIHPLTPGHALKDVVRGQYDAGAGLTVSMDFAYGSYFKMEPNTGHETLIYDCMIGGATLFQRADNVEAGWHAVQPILDAWVNIPPKDFPNCVAGGDGLAAADELLARDGRAWRPLE
jgi:glucose-6-phosphate 1-dehydrogenase